MGMGVKAPIWACVIIYNVEIKNFNCTENYIFHLV